jgi:phage host-nuclease inhibitor protein Gam
MSMTPLAEFDTAPVQRETFTVDNDAKADWALRKLGAIRAKIEENKAIAQAEAERIAAWLEHVNAAFADDIGYFEGQLRQYAETQRAEGRKSVELPHGKIKSRAVNPKFAVEDKEAFLAWARANNPALIRITEAPAITEMNTALSKSDVGVAVDANGEVVPGVSVVDASVSYTFETE